MMDSEIVVIGSGIAGASIASELAKERKVILLERESHPGYHSTGRSAAIYVESYGNEVVRTLTTASRAFYESPPEGFSEGPLWSERGNLHVADATSLAKLEQVWVDATRFSSAPFRITTQEALDMVPVLRPEMAVGAFVEPGTMDLDVDRIHQGYLRKFKQLGGMLICNAEVRSMESDAGQWSLQLEDGRKFTTEIVVNAAGAWADAIAEMASISPAGVIPKRRTAIIVDAPEGSNLSRWPMVVDAAEQYYFKPEAGKILFSPADATPTFPSDVQPEELDVAIAVDRVLRATTMTVRRIEHSWAGLRCFASDNSPVVGFSSEGSNFFWFAGQGGYGIQLAPALARLGASLLLGNGIPPDLTDLGLMFKQIDPERQACKREMKTIA